VDIGESGNLVAVDVELDASVGGDVPRKLRKVVIRISTAVVVSDISSKGGNVGLV
jgi:hypothetical protein